MMAVVRGCALAMFAVAVVGLQRSARADETDKAAAEALFQQGKAALDAGRVADACPKLTESLRLDRAIGTLLNLARCHELEGKTATAWAEYREVADLATRAGQTERAKGAAELAAKLEPTLATLKIEAPRPVPGLALARDGIAFGAGSLGVPMPVDPGEHKVVASAPGYATWSTSVSIATGDQPTVTIPALQKARAAPDAAASSATAPGSTARTAGIVLGGVGVLGLGLGAVFGVMTISAVGDARADPSLCPNDVCTPRGRDQIDAAATKGWVSTIAFGLGAAALGAGAFLVLTSSKSAPKRDAARIDVRPFATGRDGGLAMRGAF